jgi:hypothetical protein
MLNIEKRITLKEDKNRGLQLNEVVNTDSYTFYEVVQHEFCFYSDLRCESVYLYDKLYACFGIV